MLAEQLIGSLNQRFFGLRARNQNPRHQPKEGGGCQQSRPLASTRLRSTCRFCCPLHTHARCRSGSEVLSSEIQHPLFPGPTLPSRPHSTARTTYMIGATWSCIRCIRSARKRADRPLSSVAPSHRPAEVDSQPRVSRKPATPRGTATDAPRRPLGPQHQQLPTCVLAPHPFGTKVAQSIAPAGAVVIPPPPLPFCGRARGPLAVCGDRSRPTSSLRPHTSPRCHAGWLSSDLPGRPRAVRDRSDGP